MFALIATVVFVVIGLLGGFHVISMSAMAWSFVVWFAIALIQVTAHNASAPESEEDLVPPRRLGGYVSDADLDNAFPLGRSHVVNPSQGGGQSNSALLALMKTLEAQNLKDEPLKSDDRYEEPQATYPTEMRL